MVMGGITEKYPDERRAAEHILLQGWMTVSEIAIGLGVSRQLVRHWAEASCIDYRAKRAAYLKSCFRAAKRGLLR